MERLENLNVLVPLEEAIYYLEEVLRESSKVLECQTARAPILQNWLIKVDNALTIIYGINSEQNVAFSSLLFGSGNFTGGKDRDEFVSGVRKAVCMLRECVADLKRAFLINQFSRDCFVAMWFDPSMEEVYQVGICKPLKELGYNPIRVDKFEHNDRIDQKIFDLIRHSRFMVADISGHRGGVYYEAGFAFGLGLPVIQTCRKEDFEKRHFDVFTINTIVYDKPIELAARIVGRIQETI